MTEAPISTQEGTVERSGELSAADFWARYQGELGPVCGFVSRLGVSGSEVEDVAHDVFVVAYQRRATFDTRRPIRPWLFGIAAHVARARGRRAHRAREVAVELPEIADSGQGPDEKLAEREARALLSRAMDALDVDQRTVFVLHDLEEQTMPIIAETLGISVNTAYSRLRLARQKLNQAFSVHREAP